MDYDDQKEKQMSATAWPQAGLAEIQDPSAGRLDAQRIADYLGVPLPSLAPAIGERVVAGDESPSSVSIQDKLNQPADVLVILSRLFDSKQSVRAWLNSPHPDLGSQSPMSFILSGKAAVVSNMLQAALAGQPS